MKKKIRCFIADESGPTAVEYAVMLAMILLAVLGAVTQFGITTQGSYNGTTAAMEAAINNG